MSQIPDYKSLMLPLLQMAADGETSTRTAMRQLATTFELPAANAPMLRDGRSSILKHRAHWARIHMARAGLIEEQQRGVFRATARGHAVLGRNPEHLETHRPAPVARRDSAAPDVDAALCATLIDRILAIAHGPQGSAAFEQLGIDLLLAMGYGGGRRDAAIRLGRSGDGGVDAVIRLDPLGLDLLYLQAKCYKPDHRVDVAAVRDFSGSLDAKTFSRGVLMTTSCFTKGAEAYVRATPKPIALIDGAELTRLMVERGVGIRKGRLMIEHEVGVQESGTGVKKVENGYFERLQDA